MCTDFEIFVTAMASVPEETNFIDCVMTVDSNYKYALEADDVRRLMEQLEGEINLYHQVFMKLVLCAMTQRAGSSDCPLTLLNQGHKSSI